jgi:hypothetical protein
MPNKLFNEVNQEEKENILCSSTKLANTNIPDQNINQKLALLKEPETDLRSMLKERCNTQTSQLNEIAKEKKTNTNILTNDLLACIVEE